MEVVPQECYGLPYTMHVADICELVETDSVATANRFLA